jgi:hypothetical protein
MSDPDDTRRRIIPASPQLHNEAAADLVAALASLTDPPKEGTVNAGQRRYRFLELPDLLAEVRTKFGQHGWAVMQIPDVFDGHVSITNIWLHRSGVKLTHPPFTLPAGKDPQSIGSAVTYARRYSLAALCGLAGHTDDDGQAAQQATQRPQQPRTTPAQDREQYGQTRPVERAQARADEPDPRFTTPPARPAALENTTERLPHTFDPLDPSRPASQASVRKMFATLREAGILEADVQKQAIARVFGVDPDTIHTNDMSQRAVSAVIEWYSATPEPSDE